jgi:hypothetical protein
MAKWLYYPKGADYRFTLSNYYPIIEHLPRPGQ